MKEPSLRPLVASVLVMLVTVVCNLPVGGTPTPTPAPSDYLIPPTTKIIDASLQASLQSLSEDGTLVFDSSSPLLESLEPGDVLVSGTAEAAPYGFLRKVRTVTVDGGRVVVQTDDAELIEAVHEGHVAFTQDLRPEDIRTTWLRPGVTFNTQRKAGLAAPQPAGLLLVGERRPASLSYSIDTDFGTGGKVRVVGNASLEPKLEADVNISCNDKVFGVCAEIPDLNFMTRIAILEDVSLSVKGSASDFHKKVEIARHEFKPLTFWIGPVPVVFIPILGVYLQGDGTLTSNVEYAIGQRLTLAAGFAYNSDSGWKDLSEASFDFVRPSPGYDGQVDIRGAVGGEFKMLLYGVLGPFASLEAGPRFRANIAGLPSEGGVLWRAEGCVWLFVGIDSVKIIKLKYQKELYKACAGFGDGANQAPIVEIKSPNQGTQVYQGESLKLRATIFDPDGGQLTCRWTSDPGGDPFPLTACGEASVTFNSAGSRALTLAATDPAGAIGRAAVNINVLPPPTILASIANPLDGGTVGPDEMITLSGSASGGEGPYNFAWRFVYPTDAAGNGGNTIDIGGGESLAWAPSNSVSFAGCEVNAYGRLILEVQDANGYSGSRSIVIAIMRIC